MMAPKSNYQMELSCLKRSPRAADLSEKEKKYDLGMTSNSAGNSYVFETEVPLIYNGTYDPGFTIDLHCMVKVISIIQPPITL